MEQRGVRLLLLAALSSPVAAQAVCPCVTSTWSYGGDEYRFCNNPNGARTDWCPTQLNADGSYTSDLPFVYCEADTATACEAAAEDSAPTCPCLPEWRYKGESYSFCADPAGTGAAWCATATDSAGNYKAGHYARCSAAVLESCEAAEDAEPASPCPCLPGGQWTFDGERQSFCQKPQGIGRAPWCPRSEANLTSTTMGSASIAYCGAKKLKACKLLAGTKLPPQCPCVEGGQFKYKGRQYSYCENSKWCATKVDDAGRFIGKFAKCKAKGVRRACHALHELSTTAGKEAEFGTSTAASTGCPCWFDLSRTDCACCEAGAVQCGAPLHNYCAPAGVGRRAGCTGLPASHWTLSTTGYPCYWNTSRTDCAWCAVGGAQCGPGPRGPDSPVGSRCWDAEDPSYCDSIPGDCLHINKCDSQADCKFSVKFGAHREHHTCQCRDGWTGNGLQCYDAVTGAASPEEMSGPGSTDVVLSLAVTSDYYVFPHNSSQFPSGPGQTNLLANISALFEAGASCAGGSKTCNGTFANLVESPGP